MQSKLRASQPVFFLPFRAPRNFGVPTTSQLDNSPRQTSTPKIVSYFRKVNHHVTLTKMCRTFTFYHLCGHIHHNHTIPCSSPVPFTSSPPASHAPSPTYPDTKILSPSPSCVDVVNEPHHYPTLCNSCKAVGLVSDWFAKSPHARTEAILEWRKREITNLSALRSRARASSIPNANAPDILGTRDVAKDADGEEAEAMPFLKAEEPYSHSRSESEGRNEAEAEEWIHSTAEGWIRSSSSASSTRTVLRIDSPDSLSSAISPSTSPSSTPFPDESSSPLSSSEKDRSTWPQWLLDEANAPTDPHNQPSPSPASQTLIHQSAGPTPAPAPAPAPASAVKTKTRNLKPTIAETKTIPKTKTKNAKSRLPLPAAPVVVAKKNEKKEEKRSLLPLPKPAFRLGTR